MGLAIILVFQIHKYDTKVGISINKVEALMKE